MFMAFQVDERTFKVCSILGMSDLEPEDLDKGRNYFVKASIGQGEYYYQCYKFERDGMPVLSHTKSNGHERCDTDAPPFHKAVMDLGR